MGTTNDLSTKEKICDAALSLLRQDVGYSDSESVADKCDNVWAIAWESVKSSHEWKCAMGAVSDTPPTATRVRHLLVYSMARELAIPITGRQEDLKTIESLYEQKLAIAVADDLTEEMDALRASTDDGDKFAVQVLDTMTQYFPNVTGQKPQARGIAGLKKHINSIKDSIRKEILYTHDWSFAKKEVNVRSAAWADGRWRTEYPGEAVRIIKAYGEFDVKPETFTREGHYLISYEPLSRIVYLYDDEDIDNWSQLAIKAYVLKTALALAIANPSLGGGDQVKAQYINQIATKALEDAKTADARQANAGHGAYGRNYLYDIMCGRGRLRGFRGFIGW